jgi:hypothetical protein
MGPSNAKLHPFINYFLRTPISPTYILHFVRSYVMLVTQKEVRGYLKDQPTNSSNPAANTGLHVTVVDTTTDVGVTGSFVKTLIYYGSKAGDAASQTLAKALLDRMWTNYRDTIGVAVPETRTDYSQFNDSVSIPTGWTGVNGQGATLNSSATFISERPKYKTDPAWPKVQTYLNGGAAPTFTYHRFWAQADVAIAYAEYDMLYPPTA